MLGVASRHAFWPNNLKRDSSAYNLEYFCPSRMENVREKSCDSLCSLLQCSVQPSLRAQPKLVNGNRSNSDRSYLAFYCSLAGICATPIADSDMISDSTHVIHCQKKFLAQALRDSNETAGLARYINKIITQNSQLFSPST